MRVAQEKKFMTHDGTELFYRYWPARNGSAEKAIVLFHRGHEHSTTPGRARWICAMERLADLDGAMSALRLQSETKPERDLAERAQGLIWLIRWLGWLLVGQLALLAALAWLY